MELVVGQTKHGVNEGSLHFRHPSIRWLRLLVSICFDTVLNPTIQPNRFNAWMDQTSADRTCSSRLWMLSRSRCRSKSFKELTGRPVEVKRGNSASVKNLSTTVKNMNRWSKFMLCRRISSIPDSNSSLVLCSRTLRETSRNETHTLLSTSLPSSLIQEHGECKDGSRSCSLLYLDPSDPFKSGSSILNWNWNEFKWKNIYTYNDLIWVPK